MLTEIKTQRFLQSIEPHSPPTGLGPDAAPGAAIGPAVKRARLTAGPVATATPRLGPWPATGQAPSHWSSAKWSNAKWSNAKWSNGAQEGYRGGESVDIDCTRDTEVPARTF